MLVQIRGERHRAFPRSGQRAIHTSLARKVTVYLRELATFRRRIGRRLRRVSESRNARGGACRGIGSGYASRPPLRIKGSGGLASAIHSGSQIAGVSCSARRQEAASTRALPHGCGAG